MRSPWQKRAVQCACIFSIMSHRANASAPLNEWLRRGGRKRRLGLEAPNYLVVGIRESVLEKTTVTPLRLGLIDALILEGLALRAPKALVLSRNSAWE